MKTFFQFMEQVSYQQQQNLEKQKQNAITNRQRNRYNNLQRLHMTMHLGQTAAQERQGMQG
jgi:hypothetical protein